VDRDFTKAGQNRSFDREFSESRHSSHRVHDTKVRGAKTSAEATQRIMHVKAEN
jgi:hypothetical protein